MPITAHFSFVMPVFNGLTLPAEGYVSGYAAIVNKLQLAVPITKPIVIVSLKSKRIKNDDFLVLSQSYQVKDTSQHTEIESLYNHLVFALKYEGVNLLVFSAIVKHYSTESLVQLLGIEATGQYSRRMWFLIEWLLQKELKAIPNLTNKKSYVTAIDTKLQYAVTGVKSSRHLVLNNLPGTVNFCPLIKKTDKLESYIAENIKEKKIDSLKGFKKDVLQRTAVFLLLKDSKASFTIEGESPKSKRTARWGKIIGQAGTKKLSTDELLRLQQEIIENIRFVKMGFRRKGGFVGEHNRTSGEPIPEHISAKWEDVPLLLGGMLETNLILAQSNIDAVLAATSIAFGFVFIHPFEDGNGRIHRYLIHHILAKKEFTQQGLIFPVSASILDHITDYRKILEQYSHSILDFIDWKETKGHNIEVLNNTIDYYRYFDATKQAEFLYDCVNDTIENIIPQEIAYLQKYDAFKKYIEEEFEMPDSTIALLVRFLEQNEGKLSKRAKEKEFLALSENEITEIESNYELIMNS